MLQASSPVEIALEGILARTLFCLRSFHTVWRCGAVAPTVRGNVSPRRAAQRETLCASMKYDR